MISLVPLEPWHTYSNTVETSKSIESPNTVTQPEKSIIGTHKIRHWGRFKYLFIVSSPQAQPAHIPSSSYPSTSYLTPSSPPSPPPTLLLHLQGCIQKFCQWGRTLVTSKIRREWLIGNRGGGGGGIPQYAPADFSLSTHLHPPPRFTPSPQPLTPLFLPLSSLQPPP